MILKGLDDYQKEIAGYIKLLRLDEAEHTQKSKALQCGIPFATYVKLENTGKGSIEMLLKILATYGLLSKIDELTKIIEPSPSEKNAKNKANRKKRIRYALKDKNND